jgi:hypothetical protein
MADELTAVPTYAVALADATTVEEIKQLRDQFSAAQQWAKDRRLGVENENKAAEWVLRAERKIGQALLSLKEEGRLREGTISDDDSSRVTLTGLGLTLNESSNYQRVASLPDDLFENMIRVAKEARERIAKVNFYAQPREKRDGPETPEDKGFETFRAGVYYLLGWKVKDDGTGSFTKNGLMQLPDDELVQVSDLLRAMLVAYQDVREQRARD